LIVAVLLMAGLQLVRDVQLARFEINGAYYSDFGRFHYSTRQFLDGRTMYVPVPESLRAPSERLRQQTDLTPPQAHLVFIPLAVMPIRRALWLWIALNLAAVWWSAATVLRTIGLTPTPAQAVFGVAAAVASAPFAAWMITGQVSFVYLVPLVIAWRASRRSDWAVAGAWLGILWTLKPFLGLFAVGFLIHRRWRALGWSALSSAASLMCGAATWGGASFLEWLRDLSMVSWAAHVRNASLLGFWQRVFPGPGHVSAFLVSAALALAAALWAMRRTASIDREWLTTLVASLLISPLGWIYYWWWLAPPAGAIWFADRPQRATSRWLFMAGIATAWWPWSWSETSPTVASPAFGSVYVFGLVALLVSLVSAASDPVSNVTAHA
jgi:alpha-1,2-mannosyltransferase